MERTITITNKKDPYRIDLSLKENEINIKLVSIGLDLDEHPELEIDRRLNIIFEHLQFVLTSGPITKD